MRVTETTLRDYLPTFAAAMGKPVYSWNDPTSPGGYAIAGAYGGWQVQQVIDNGGAIDALDTGYVSKRELFDAMRYAVRGARIAARETGYVQCDYCRQWLYAHTLSFHVENYCLARIQTAAAHGDVEAQERLARHERRTIQNAK